MYGAIVDPPEEPGKQAAPRPPGNDQKIGDCRNKRAQRFFTVTTLRCIAIKASLMDDGSSSERRGQPSNPSSIAIRSWSDEHDVPIHFKLDMPNVPALQAAS
jgi:hypothetical protein